MQPENRSSFIPKKSIKRIERVRSGKRIYVLSYVAYVIFFATVVTSGAVYFYAQYLERNLATKIQELETQRVAFNQSNINKVKEIERQLKIAEYFFNRHSSPYAALTEIEKLAVDKVIFKSFDYVRQDTDEIEITFSGGTDRFDGLAFQKNLLANSIIFDDSNFTEVVKQGELNFNDDQTQKQSNSKTQIKNITEKPVSFTLSKTVGFEELAYNPNLYKIVNKEITPATNVSPNTDVADSNVSDTESVGSEIINETEL